MPASGADRAAIRRAAVEAAAGWSRALAPTRDRLDAAARGILGALGQSEDYLGFTMVALNNAFWMDQYAAVPSARRLLLLPHCLRDPLSCAARYDSIGLHCAGCGHCDIHGLKRRAEALGCQVVVAEGTSSVLMKVLEGEADAILGVACLDSLERSFTRVRELGVPLLAVPLLNDGCVETEAELDEVANLLTLTGGSPAEVTRSYVPLLRHAGGLFQEQALDELLSGVVSPADTETDVVALDWLRLGGKRLRPFITLAAYAVARHGSMALKPEADIDALVPPAVRRLSLAIETLHKASLVHDDVEDDDRFRYGRQTLHREFGTPPAINVGDYLIGLGYRLVAGAAPELGAGCVADVLSHLSAAHIELCRGQGAELFWRQQHADALKPLDSLAIYARKTAPAFEAALYAGLRAAETPVDPARLRRFATYLGEAYQVLNDLEEWEETAANKLTPGQDLMAARPTVLRAFATEAGRGAELREATQAHRGDRAALTARMYAIYRETGAFERARALCDGLRTRALEVAAQMPTQPLQDLFLFLVQVILEERPEPPGAGAA